MGRIFVTRRIPETGLAIVREAAEVEVEQEVEEEGVERSRLLDGVRRSDVLMSLLTERIDREVMEANPDLRGVANYAVGFNNIDVEVATELGLPVSNTPGVLTDTTADLTWALHQVEQAVHQPEVDVTIYRVPANRSLFASPLGVGDGGGAGFFNPDPVPIGRATGPVESEEIEVLLDKAVEGWVGGLLGPAGEPVQVPYPFSE